MAGVLLVVPARMASTRLPGKMLLKLDAGNQKSVLQSTYEQVRRSKYASEANAVVATCDEVIGREAVGFGAKVVRTSERCKSGSDRVAEAVRILGEEGNVDVVVNVQGDEPFLDPEHIDVAVDGLLNHDWADVATCAVKVDGYPDIDPSKVKVVVSETNAALYFSRAPIPHQAPFWLRHIGLYAYRPKVLQTFTQLTASDLEQAECLEQLRLLENNFKMLVVQVPSCGFGGVDTPDDLIRAREHYAKLHSDNGKYGR